MIPLRLARSRLLLALVFAAALAGAAAVFAWNAGRWLNTPDEAGPADAIVVLAGSYFRHLEAAALYRRGLAPVVYVSVPVPDPAAPALAALGVRLVPHEEVQEQILKAAGVPPSALRRLGLPQGNVSTYDEAEAAAGAFPRPNARLLVVTSPYHVRRTRMIFRDAFAGQDASIRVLATSQEAFPDRWWTSQGAAREVLLEWAKIGFYVLGGRFRAGGEARQ